MKGILTLLVSSFYYYSSVFAQSIGDYRSAVDGLWADAATWERLQSLPSNWSPAVSPPGTSTTSITVRSGHTVIVDELDGGNNITIEAGGVLDIAVSPSANAFQFNGDNVNNGTINWLEGVIDFLPNTTITNNGLFSIGDLSGNANMINPGTFINGASGIFSTVSVSNVIINPDFVNEGIFIGAGRVSMDGFTNRGIISPAGELPGELRFERATTILEDGSVIVIDITNNGGEGIGHDLVFFTTDRPFPFTNAELVVRDHPTAPPTSYTFIRTAGPNFSGPFESFTVPSAYSNPVIDPTSVSINKLLSTVPLTWGEFTVRQVNQSAELRWTTVQEFNTSYFEIEHSTDGMAFSLIGIVPANGNTSSISTYQYVHNNAFQNRLNYYRLRQVDLDGLFSYSRVSILTIELQNKYIVLNNPVRSVIDLTIHGTNTTLILTDIKGKVVKSAHLQPGTHHINVDELSAGVYLLLLYDDKGNLTTTRVMKM